MPPSDSVRDTPQIAAQTVRRASDSQMLPPTSTAPPRDQPSGFPGAAP